MATISSKRISEFDQVNPINGTEQFVVAKDNSNYKASMQSIYDWIKATLKADNEFLYGKSFLKDVYPVGAIYISMTGTNPLAALDLGWEWEEVGQGKCLWGAADDSQLPGTQLSAGLPNITGWFSGTEYYSTSTNDGKPAVGGAFNNTIDHNVCQGQNINDQFDQDRVYFNASKSNPIYGSSDTVQPPAIVVKFFQRVS